MSVNSKFDGFEDISIPYAILNRIAGVKLKQIWTRACGPIKSNYFTALIFTALEITAVPRTSPHLSHVESAFSTSEDRRVVSSVIKA